MIVRILYFNFVPVQLYTIFYFDRKPMKLLEKIAYCHYIKYLSVMIIRRTRSWNTLKALLISAICFLLWCMPQYTNLDILIIHCTQLIACLLIRLNEDIIATRNIMQIQLILVIFLWHYQDTLDVLIIINPIYN